MKRTTRNTALLLLGLATLSAPALGGALIISEVAWMGTAAASTDEWIELQNVSSEAVVLTGWQISYGDSLIPLGVVAEDTLEIRTTVLEPGGFLILERTDDTAISDIAYDIAYKGSLDNAGVRIELRDPQGVVVDVVDGVASGWPGGTAADGDPPCCSMERASSGDWGSNNGMIRNGLDKDGNPLNATPGQRNSVNVIADLAPTVEILHPSEENLVLHGPVLVAWVAADPNGADSALSVVVYLVTEGESEWVALGRNLANTGTFSWDTTTYAADQLYRIVIRATDVEGYTGEATSPQFEIGEATE